MGQYLVVLGQSGAAFGGTGMGHSWLVPGGTGPVCDGIWWYCGSLGQ